MNQDIRKYITLVESALASVHQIEEDNAITLDDIKSQRVVGNAHNDQHIFDMVDKFVRSSENSWEDKSEALNHMQTVVMGAPLSQEQLRLSAQQNVEAYFTHAEEEGGTTTLDDIKSHSVIGNAHDDRHIMDMIDNFARNPENSWEDRREALNYMQTVVMGAPLDQEQNSSSTQRDVEDYLAQSEE